MSRRRLAPFAVIAVGVTLLAACGDDDETSSPTLLDVPETVAMGVLPQQLSDAPTLPPPPPPPTTQPAVSSTSAPVSTSLDGPIEAPVGELVNGDRILLVGDSVLASVAPRNEGQLCDALVLFGWQVEIDAVPERGLDFADEVLEARLPHEDVDGDDWDVVALSFGSDVDGTDADAVAEFGTQLGELIDHIAPRPVLLYTLADDGAAGEDGNGRAAVNEVIREQPESHPNVLVVEFADAGDDGVQVLDDAGQALTDDGMKRFSIRTAAAVGDAPGDGDGDCLPSKFGD